MFGAVRGKPFLPGLFHPVEACLADRVAVALVFVVGGDVARPLVEPDRVVVHLDHVLLGSQGGGVGDRELGYKHINDLAL